MLPAGNCRVRLSSNHPEGSLRGNARDHNRVLGIGRLEPVGFGRMSLKCALL